MKALFTSSTVALCLFISFFLNCFSASSSLAAINGRWVCKFDLSGSGNYPQDMLLTESAGVVSGTEVYTGTDTTFANVAGTISGNNFSIRATYTSLKLLC